MEKVNNNNVRDVLEDVNDYIGYLLDEIDDLKSQNEQLKDDKEYYEEQCRAEGIY